MFARRNATHRKEQMLALGKYSIGVGDRFGHQAKAQLRACLKAARQGVDVIPVWNKSNREHVTIGTEPSSVRAAADAIRALADSTEQGLGNFRFGALVETAALAAFGFIGSSPTRIFSPLTSPISSAVRRRRPPSGPSSPATTNLWAGLRSRESTRL